MAKTQVVDGIVHVEGTIGVFNQDDYPILISAPTKMITAYAGGWWAVIRDISTEEWQGPDPPPSPQNPDVSLIFARYLKFGWSPDPWEGPWDHWVGHDFVIFYEDTPRPWNVTGNFSFATGTRRIWRSETLTYGQNRSNRPVFAYDVHYNDEWQGEETYTWNASFCNWSASGSGPAEEQPPEGNTYAWPIHSLQLGFYQHKGHHWQKYARAENLQWNYGTLNFSRYEKCSVPGVKPPSQSMGNYLDGENGAITLYSKSPSNWSTSILMHRPLIIDFSKFAIWDRDGKLKSDIKISGGFRANNHIPATLEWSTE